jgi:hypothetical protein
VVAALLLAPLGLVVTASAAQAASVRITGFANCVGILGYPSPDGEPATSVRITTSYENRSATVNAIGYYGINMTAVPSTGVDAKATVSCRSGRVWELPFRLTPSTTSLDLTNPTPVDLTVNLKDPLNGSPINTRPVHPTRPLTVEIYNDSKQLVAKRTPTAQQFGTSGQYRATIYLGHTSGVRWFKVWLDYTLHKQVESFINVPAIPGPWHYSLETSLIAGDVDQNNTLNTTDYNLIVACYGTKICSYKRGADVNDDGVVDGIDINLWLRIKSTVAGA